MLRAACVRVSVHAQLLCTTCSSGVGPRSSNTCLSCSGASLSTRYVAFLASKLSESDSTVPVRCGVGVHSSIKCFKFHGSNEGTHSGAASSLLRVSYLHHATDN